MQEHICVEKQRIVNEPHAALQWSNEHLKNTLQRKMTSPHVSTGSNWRRNTNLSSANVSHAHTFLSSTDSVATACSAKKQNTVLHPVIFHHVMNLSWIQNFTIIPQFLSYVSHKYTRNSKSPIGDIFDKCETILSQIEI